MKCRDKCYEYIKYTGVKSEVIGTRSTHYQCEEDHECDPNFYCYEVSHTCAQCTECEAYNRKRNVNVQCPKSPSDCGDCLFGFESKKLTDGANQNFCSAMNYLQASPPDKIQFYSTFWMYGVLFLITSVIILLCLVVNKILKNRSNTNGNQETEFRLGNRIIQSSLSRHVTEEIQHNINIVEIDHDYLQQDVPYRYNESIVSLHFDEVDQDTNDDPTDSDFHDADTVSPIESPQLASDCDDAEFRSGSISIDSFGYDRRASPAGSLQLSSDCNDGEIHGASLNDGEDIAAHCCIQLESGSCILNTGDDDASMSSCQHTEILAQNIDGDSSPSASTVRSFIIDDSSSERSGPDDSGISGDSSHNISILYSPEDCSIRHFKMFARSCDSDESEPETKRRKDDSGSGSVGSLIFEEVDSSNTED